ncbi:ArsR/SmtB family transcription factor [Actinophytocola gossypii]|uniref:Helix-turn-helix transcriptional regulator n=1 Tax=Actinophytocola gossypii TaxID=2812003 RepID=A0ABT2JH53_9PSEU|nr:helix-turn-helix domain-containing protein [Actinophytocola gossypii]MCT2587211.1 helix-turn-helix transcriptional regulator [Actinophytocola gossypii]
MRHRVTDSELMGALAHPLRAALLRHLMAVGPRTASECAEAVGSTASNCSWHLRQLARFGLVEEAGERGGRERPWRSAVVGLELGEPAADPTTNAARRAILANALNEEATLTQRFLDRADELEPEWRDAGALDTYGLTITADELRQLVARIDELVRPYVATVRTAPPDDARAVHLGLRAFRRLDRA